MPGPAQTMIRYSAPSESIAGATRDGGSAWSGARRGGGRLPFPQELKLSPRDPALPSSTVPDVGEAERPVAAHRLRVARHHAEVRADVRREIDLVDDEEVRARDARPALARNLVAAGHVDDVNGGIDELRAEAGGEVVAAALEQNQIEARMPRRHLLDRIEVHRRVFTNRRVRAAARLDADDAVGRERLAAHEELHVFPGEDVVGDDAQAIAIAHRLAERVDQRRLARPHRPADPQTHPRAEE